jgi:hypothetical protein
MIVPKHAFQNGTQRKQALFSLPRTALSHRSLNAIPGRERNSSRKEVGARFVPGPVYSMNKLGNP